MQKTVSTYLNVRAGEPSTNAPCLEYLAPGAVVDVTESLAGTVIEGNNIWFKDISNNYYWSGGFETTSLGERLISYLRDKPISEFLLAGDKENLFSNNKQFEGIGWSIENNVLYASILYSGSNIDSLPKFLTIKIDENDIHQLPVKVIPTKKIKAFASLIPSASIKNNMPLRSTSGENRGSIGCFIKKKNEASVYALTCYHVIRSNDNLAIFDIRNATDNFSFDVVELISNNAVGRITDGFIDDDTDAALISLFDDVTLDFKIPTIGSYVNPRDLKDIDINNKIPVFMYDAISKKKKIGTCDSIHEVFINYGDVIKKINNLIVIKSGVEPFSSPGNSGSVVLDSRNAVIGLLIAGNNEFSFVLPINRILKNFKGSLYPKIIPR